jgi:hypothetical protein
MRGKRKLMTGKSFVGPAPTVHPNVCKQKGPSHFGSISLRQDNNGRTKDKLGPELGERESLTSLVE